jgi:O-acetyl-ADP-ribose deacetylase (regulator of RNase III)
MRVVGGDLVQMALEGRFDVIVHGCNCFCTMGAGIAKGIKSAFPEAYKADRATAKGAKNKLGTCSFAECPAPNGAVVVVNAYTQYRYGKGGAFVDYDAVRRCLRWVAATFPGKRVGMPRIGCGLAGGDWRIVEAIMDEETRGLDATVVELRRGSDPC